MRFPSAARPLNPARWLLAPAALAAVASLLFTAPLRVFGLPLPEPVFALAPVFAWGVIRPSALAPFLSLALGLWLDLLWGGPLGLWGAGLLAAYAVAAGLRSIIAGQSAPVLWGWFLLVTAMAFGIGYAVTVMTALTPPNLLATGLQALVTAALYPFAHSLIDRFEDADVRYR